MILLIDMNHSSNSLPNVVVSQLLVSRSLKFTWQHRHLLNLTSDMWPIVKCDIGFEETQSSQKVTWGMGENE